LAILSSYRLHSAITLSFVLPVRYVPSLARTRTLEFTTFAAEALGQKHTDWRYEHEVRLARPLDSFLNRTARNRIGLIKFDASCIATIVVGLNPTAQVCALLEEQWNEFRHIRLGQMAVSSDRYEARVLPRLNPGEIIRPTFLPANGLSD
jgi:hypothetical protein